MEKIDFNYKSKDTFEASGNTQEDIYQVIKLELGYFFEEKYEDSMDNLATSTSFSQIQYYENESQTIRRIKTALKDKKIKNLQKYIATKRDDLKDGLMSSKDQKHLTSALDILEKCNKNILQLTYNIALEIKEGILKKNKIILN